MSDNPVGRRLLAGLAATGFFAFLTILCLTPTLSAGGRDFAPSIMRGESGEDATSWEALTRIDGTFVAAQVRRNSIALLEEPTRIFQREMCYPHPNSLTTGDPMITAGVLGLPGQLLIGGAAGAVNSAVGFSILLKALAMYLLVSLWTGSATAGIVAGLLFSFDTDALDDVTHFYIYDTTWFVFALYFASLFFRSGSWIAGVSIVICTVLQVANCLYPAVAAATLALPMATWLYVAYSPSLPKVVLITASSAAGVALIYAPYLSNFGSDTGADVVQNFLIPQMFRAGALTSSEWTLLALAFIGILSPRRRATSRTPKDPRWALVAGALLCTWLAIGSSLGSQLNLFSVAAQWVPGLDLVRAPLRIFEGAKLVAAVLAGMGTAALLSWLPAQAGRVATIVLLCAVTATTAGAVLAPPPGLVVPLRVAPSEAVLKLFGKLAAIGNRGPVFEFPVTKVWLLGSSADRVMASTFHRRPTSACSGSVKPQSVQELTEIGKHLPDPDAVAQLRDAGFTTVVVHSRGGAQRFGWKLLIMPRNQRPLRLLAQTSFGAAYEIEY